jgi:Flp pilus assembly protein TadG
MRVRGDDGSAIVEFVWLAVLLMLPLVYVVLGAMSVQRAAFGLTEAARQAARAYATAGSDALGERRAEAIVTIVLHDQGIGWTPSGRVVDCGPCDYSPGSAFAVRLSLHVPLPLIPQWLCRQRCLAGVTVFAHHTERLSCFTGTGPPAASC